MERGESYWKPRRREHLVRMRLKIGDGWGAYGNQPGLQG